MNNSNSFITLKQVGDQWEFESEATLENFIWDNLHKLLGLTPFKRQYSIKGQFCDILALDQNKSLIILELKNKEDRYVIQQLTRYYHALLEQSPFTDEINLQQFIRLIAICPNYHNDNLIDIRYNNLIFDLFQFNLEQEDGLFYFNLFDTENKKIAKIEIKSPHFPSEKDYEIPHPPKALINMLSKAELTEEQKSKIFDTRARILKFNERIKEIVKANRVIYGNGKSNPLAEFYYSDKEGLFIVKGINLLLWLPYNLIGNTDNSNRKVRTLINTDWNKECLIRGHSPKGLTIKTFCGNRNNHYSLEQLVDIALEEWRKKL